MGKDKKEKKDKKSKSESSKNLDKASDAKKQGTLSRALGRSSTKRLGKTDSKAEIKKGKNADKNKSADKKDKKADKKADKKGDKKADKKADKKEDKKPVKKKSSSDKLESKKAENEVGKDAASKEEDAPPPPPVGSDEAPPPFPKHLESKPAGDSDARSVGSRGGSTASFDSYVMSSPRFAEPASPLTDYGPMPITSMPTSVVGDYSNMPTEDPPSSRTDAQRRRNSLPELARVTEDQAVLLRTAFDRIRPISTQAAEAFYDGFFSKHPDAEDLFPSNEFRKRAKVVKMFDKVAQALPDIDSLEGELLELGKLHVEYEAAPKYFEEARNALLEVVEAEFSKTDEWTAEMRQAFSDMYDLVAEKMFIAYPESEVFPALEARQTARNSTKEARARASAVRKERKKPASAEKKKEAPKEKKEQPKEEEAPKEQTKEQPAPSKPTGPARAPLGTGASRKKLGQKPEPAKRGAGSTRDLQSSGMDIPFDQLSFDTVIGEGAFGQTWKGKWRHKRVALKEVKPTILVDESWSALEPVSDQVASLFYNRLFEIAPDTRELFPKSMAMQNEKLMKLLGTAVGALRDLPALVPAVVDLGKRHAMYGVSAKMYDDVAAALLWTLEKGLGDLWTDELKSAWVSVYTVLASVMKESMAEEYKAMGFEPEDGDAGGEAEAPTPTRIMTPTEWIAEKKIALENAEEVLADEGIESLEDLAMLDDAMLKELGIKRIGDRSKFKALREEMKSGNAPTTADDGAAAGTGDKDDDKKDDDADGGAADDGEAKELISAEDIERVQKSWATVIPQAPEEKEPEGLTEAQKLARQKRSEVGSSGTGLSSQALTEMFKEAEKMQRLPFHQNVVQYLGICRRPILIVMEFCNGGSLDALLNDPDCDLGDSDKIRIMADISHGCAHLHRAGLIHKDIAARNVLLDKRRSGSSARKYDYTAKICDIGLSSFQDEIDWDQVDDGNKQPLKWLAPEVLSERRYSRESDVWAFGITCVEILTERAPWAAVPTTAFGKIALESAPLAHLLVPKHTDKDLAEVVTQCLDVQPDGRPTFEEALDSLSPLLGDQDGESSSSSD